jgi:hypothetical protein
MGLSTSVQLGEVPVRYMLQVAQRRAAEGLGAGR